MVWACCLWISHGPMCTPSTVLNPRLTVSSRRKAIFSSRKWHESHALVDTPVPADVMHAPFSGLPSEPDCGQRDEALRSRLRLADDRLERDLAPACRRSPARAGSRAAPGSCRPRTRRSCRRSRRCSDRRPARTFLRILSNVPWPPRSGRMRLCVSRSPSSVTLTPSGASAVSRSTTSGVSSRPLVMMLNTSAISRARHDLGDALGEVVHDRQVEERFAAEERQREALRPRRASIRASIQLDDARRGLHRHLRGGLVVLAVVALDAVVAREIALQRRQHRHAKLIRARAVARRRSSRCCG